MNTNATVALSNVALFGSGAAGGKAAPEGRVAPAVEVVSLEPAVADQEAWVVAGGLAEPGVPVTRRLATLLEGVAVASAESAAGVVRESTRGEVVVGSAVSGLVESRPLKDLPVPARVFQASRVARTAAEAAAAETARSALRTSPGTLTGTLDAGYLVATPASVDTFSGPLHITGLAGTVDCTGTLSNASAELDTTYRAALDYLDDAFVYELLDPQTQGLTANLITSGCGVYGYASSFVQPYLIDQIRVLINNQIHNNFSPEDALLAPGVGDTICPAP